AAEPWPRPMAAPALAIIEHRLVVDDDKADGLVARHPECLFANHEARSALTIEPCVGANLPWRAVVGAAAELHAEGEALRIEVFPRKPVAGNAWGAREPFPPPGGMADDETWKLIQIDEADRCGGHARLEGLTESAD